MTKNLGFELCNLTLMILTKETSTETIFLEKSLTVKLYKVLKSLNSLLQEDNIYDKTFPIFFLLNLATKKEFHLIIGKHLVFTSLKEPLSFEEFLQNFQNNLSFLLSYIRIFIPFFLDMLIFYIYDVETNSFLKKWSFSLIAGLLSESSRFNAFLLKDDSFIEKILFYLRLEKDQFIKKTFLKMLKAFLKDNFTLKILKAYLSN